MEATNSSETLKGRLPSLDGWRALSIVLVLGAHTVNTFDFPEKLDRILPFLFPGLLGVRFFFVISGFLITWLLLKEGKKFEKCDLKQFYLRRSLRILPVYALFLVVLLLLHLTPWHLDRFQWLGLVTFTVNFSNAVTNDLVILHLWSLSIEEQFYLVWPLVLSLCQPWRHPKKAFVWLLIPVIVCPVFRAFAFGALHHGKSFGLNVDAHLLEWSSTLQHADSLALGCLGAVGVFHFQEALTGWSAGRLCWLFMGGLMLVLAPHVLMTKGFGIPGQGLILVPFGNSLQATGFLILMILSLFFPETHFFQILNSRPIVWLGKLSYSIYIWQQLFCRDPRLFGLGPVWWMSSLGWLVPVFLVSTTSYYLVEKPCLSLKKKWSLAE